MSLSRLALRLAAIEALCPSAAAAAGPWPTLAANQVWDSRITPIADEAEWRKFLAEIEGKPLISVYTEDHESETVVGEYPAEKEIVDLTLELMIAAQATLTYAAADGSSVTSGTVTAQVTSAEHEATLDMLEAQVRGLLDPQSQLCPPLYFKVARELHHVRSVPVRDADNRVSRVAARTVTMRIRVPHALPVSALAVGVDPAIASLPEPLLTVAKALAPTSYGGMLVRRLAQAQTANPTLAPLSDIRINTSLDRGVAPTADDADLVSDVSF